MRNFEILPHTADIRMKVTGSSLEELLHGALEGMNSIIKDDRELGDPAGEKEKISIDSIDSSVLLVDFLSEVLSLSHHRKLLYYISSIKKLNDNHIDCHLNGFTIEAFEEDIKAVTYTEANIIKNEENLFETIIVFDI